MRIVSIQEKTVHLPSSIRTADISFDEMTASALVIESDVLRNGKPVCGLAFSSAGRYGHGGLLRERFIPRLLAASPEDYADERGTGIDPFKAWSIVMRNEKPGGHGERCSAVGLMDAAVWDLQSKLEDMPLWALLQQRFGTPARNHTAAYASGGHYRPSNDLSSLKDDIQRFLDMGYRTVKIKAGGQPLDQDRTRIESVLALLPAGHRLAIDCNSGLPEAELDSWLHAMHDYDLAWMEDLVDPLDFQLYAHAASIYDKPISTGENIYSLPDTKNLIRYAGLRPATDMLNMDILHSYGLIEYLRMLDFLEAHGWSRSHCSPHAGHLFALHACCGLDLGQHETAPLHHPLGGLPPGTTIQDGRIYLSDLPGVGLDSTDSFMPMFTDLLPH